MAKKSHVSDAAISAAFDLVTERGWRSISLADIAERANVPLAEIVDRFPAKAVLLDSYFRSVDSRMLAGGTELGENVRDRLFDVLMRRFEAMAPDRRALSIIFRESGDDPYVLFCGLRRFLRSMTLTLETAGLSSSGLGGLVRLKGVSAIYLYALRAFFEDETPDLTRTMASLDKALRRAEGIASMLWARRDLRSRSHTAAEGGT